MIIRCGCGSKIATIEQVDGRRLWRRARARITYPPAILGLARSVGAPLQRRWDERDFCIDVLEATADTGAALFVIEDEVPAMCNACGKDHHVTTSEARAWLAEGRRVRFL